MDAARWWTAWSEALHSLPGCVPGSPLVARLTEAQRETLGSAAHVPAFIDPVASARSAWRLAHRSLIDDGVQEGLSDIQAVAAWYEAQALVTGPAPVVQEDGTVEPLPAG